MDHQPPHVSKPNGLRQKKNNKKRVMSTVIGLKCWKICDKKLVKRFHAIQFGINQAQKLYDKAVW